MTLKGHCALSFMNESQPSVTEYLSASSMALTLSFDTIMTAIAIFLELNSN